MLGSAELDVEFSQLERLEVAFGLERPRRLEHRCRESMLIAYLGVVLIATKSTLSLTATSSSPGPMKRCANCSHFLPRIHNIAGILCFMHVARHFAHNNPHTCPAVF